MTPKSWALVSIVMPAFNCEHLIAEAVDSVVAQSYQNWELIVVDNFSTDNTKGVIGSYSDPRIRLTSAHGTIGTVRNEGWRLAQGNLIAFLDADDKYHPSKLSTQVPHHISENILTYHDLRLFGERKYGRVRGRRIGTNPVTDILTGGNPIATSSSMMSRTLIESCGGFPESPDFFSAEDLGLWLLMAERNAHFLYIRKTLGAYRTHNSSSSSGKSTNAARQVVAQYSKKLSRRHKLMLDGWLSYSEAALPASRRVQASHLLTAAIQGAWRFKWRAVLRLILLFR